MKHGELIQCWKVVEPSPFPFQYLSLFTMEEYCLEYRDGETTQKVPGSMGIFAFTYLEAAREYKEYTERLAVSEYANRVAVAVIISGDGVVCQSRGIRAYPVQCLRDAYSRGIPPAEPVPRGTVLLDSFRTISRVK